MRNRKPGARSRSIRVFAEPGPPPLPFRVRIGAHELRPSSEHRRRRACALAHRPRVAHSRCCRREPEPVGRERRAPLDREGLRCRPGVAEPDRGRVLARPRGVGPLPRRGRRPLRAQVPARPRYGARGPGLAPAGVVACAARVGGGLAAGMAYPTTLALITALWSGQPRTKAIALWSALGGAIASLGPLIAGGLLEHFWWGAAL